MGFPVKQVKLRGWRANKGKFCAQGPQKRDLVDLGLLTQESLASYPLLEISGSRNADAAFKIHPKTRIAHGAH